MKTFEEILYSEDDYFYAASNPLNRKPYVYIFLSFLLFSFPFLNVAGLWFGVKAIDESSWQGRNMFLSYVVTFLNSVAFILMVIFFMYLMVVYPELRNQCEGLKSGMYILDGQELICE